MVENGSFQVKIGDDVRVSWIEAMKRRRNDPYVDLTIEYCVIEKEVLKQGWKLANEPESQISDLTIFLAIP